MPTSLAIVALFACVVLLLLVIALCRTSASADARAEQAWQDFVNAHQTPTRPTREDRTTND